MVIKLVAVYRSWAYQPLDGISSLNILGFFNVFKHEMRDQGSNFWIDILLGEHNQYTQYMLPPTQNPNKTHKKTQ